MTIGQADRIAKGLESIDAPRLYELVIQMGRPRIRRSMVDTVSYYTEIITPEAALLILSQKIQLLEKALEKARETMEAMKDG